MSKTKDLQTSLSLNLKTQENKTKKEERVFFKRTEPQNRIIGIKINNFHGILWLTSCGSLLSLFFFVVLFLTYSLSKYVLFIGKILFLNFIL